MPEKILSRVLIFLTIFFSFLSWRSVDRAIFSQGASDFFVPLVFFSLFAVALSLSIVLVRGKIWIWSVVFLSLGTSLFFPYDFFHLLAVFLAWGLIVTSARNINSDIGASLRISLTKSLYRGSFLITLAFALMISSQYYFSAKRMDPADIAPNISKSGVTSQVTNFILPRINPEFRQIESNEITVDNFLGEAYEAIIRKEDERLKNGTDFETEVSSKDLMGKMIEDELGRKLTDDEKKQLEQMETIAPSKVATLSPQIKQEVLAEWKRELSRLSGLEIKGNENVTEMFVSVMNSKMDELASVEKRGTSGVLPAIFSIILFLTLVPLGSLVSRFWIMVTTGIFWILKRMGIIKIVLETKEVEVIRQ